MCVCVCLMNKRVAVGVCATERPGSPHRTLQFASVALRFIATHACSAFAGKTRLRSSRAFRGRVHPLELDRDAERAHLPTESQKCWCPRSHRGAIRLYLMPKVGVRVTGSTPARIIFELTPSQILYTEKINRIFEV